jgi:hypothetical protein
LTPLSTSWPTCWCLRKVTVGKHSCRSTILLCSSCL